MKLLLCCPYPLDPKLGGAKVYIEMAQTYRDNGAHCQLLGIDEIPSPVTFIGQPDELRFKYYPEALKDFLVREAGQFDVVEYEHTFLPFERSLFSSKALLVARSILLTHHLAAIPIPTFHTWRGFFGKLVKGPARRRELFAKIAMANKTMAEANFINVPNPDDKKILMQHGHLENKIGVFPFGISLDRLAQFSPLNLENTENLLTPTVAFVGTFDNRKGAVEFPTIVRNLVQAFSNIKIKLLGTNAMFKDEQSVLNYFPQDLRSHLMVVGRYKPEELPTYLKDCCAGIFPSHLESFGFGVLEMMASGLPVFAYDVPGPPVLLDREFLVARGDGVGLAQKLTGQLQAWKNAPQRYVEIRKGMRMRAEQFTWKPVGKKTLDTYSGALQKLRSK